MNSSVLIAARFSVYIVILVFGTHFVRTWAFNRHEAITFEFSSVAAICPILFIVYYGYDIRLIWLLLVLMIMFIGNAFTQWHFYGVLQERIKEAFKERDQYLKKHEKDNTVVDRIRIMASVAIMPSFSRFIEESNLFTNPGNPIGLIKSIIKRERFQNKKYQMRERFADSVNLIGACKPAINSMVKDDSDVVPGAIRANDLAIDYSDEVIGLLTYDILGFGAGIILFFFIKKYYYYVVEGSAIHPLILSVSRKGIPLFSVEIGIIIVILLFVCVSYLLRHLGFARYESFGYEVSFTALVISSFFAVMPLIEGGEVTKERILVSCSYLFIFIFLSFINRYSDKKLHSKTDSLFDSILSDIRMSNETDIIKRRFIKNLKGVSEWTIVPYPGTPKRSELIKRIMLTKKLRDFENDNQMKQEMPRITKELIQKVVPESGVEVDEGVFIVSDPASKVLKIVGNVISIVSFVALFAVIHQFL